MSSTNLLHPASYIFHMIPSGTATPVIVKCTTTLKWSCIGSIWPIRSALLFMVALPVHRQVRTTSDYGSSMFSFSNAHWNIFAWTYSDPFWRRKPEPVRDRNNRQLVKLTKELMISKTNATTVSCISPDIRVAKYGIRPKLPTENSLWLLSRLFVEVCTTLRVNYVPSAEYPLKTNSQSKCFKSTLILRLHHYITRHWTS